MRWIALIVGAVSLAGCASHPAPVMDAQGYEKIAKGFAIVEQCTLKGFITPMEGAEGRRLTNIELGRYQYYRQELDRQYTQQMEAFKAIDKESCNSLAASIHQYGNVGNKVVQPAVAPQNYPTYTNCSTYFGQTHCTSY